ncbi:recombinase family protein [Microvirga massiliensis]
MHILAAVAEHEAAMISQRTKAALAARARQEARGRPREHCGRQRPRQPS